MKQTLDHTAAIVLAAGKGTRLKAIQKNKVAYKLNGRPMISYTVQNLRHAGVAQLILVIGFQANSVKAALSGEIDYVVQKEQLGTGDALKTAVPALAPGIKTVLSVYGDDSAFYPPALYQDLVQKQQETAADVLVLTIHKSDPTGLGRIVRDQSGHITKIVEEKNATPQEKQIQEINTGFYCFDREFLTSHVGQIEKNPLTGEYYATDLIEIALRDGHRVSTHYLADASVWHGVNTLADYQAARAKFQDENRQ